MKNWPAKLIISAEVSWCALQIKPNCSEEDFHLPAWSRWCYFYLILFCTGVNYVEYFVFLLVDWCRVNPSVSPRSKPHFCALLIAYSCLGVFQLPRKPCIPLNRFGMPFLFFVEFGIFHKQSHVLGTRITGPVNLICNVYLFSFVDGCH